MGKPRKEKFLAIVEAKIRIVAKRFFFVAVVFLMFTSNALANYEEGLIAYNKKDYFGAYKLLLPLASKGHGESQFLLSHMYFSGKGMRKDIAEGKKWLKRSAKNNHSPAQIQLGWYISEGKYFRENQAAAKDWFSKAANSEDMNGIYMLGQSYRKGKGVKKDLVLAVEFFKKAARHGHGQATYDLGAMYMSGEGVEKDSKAGLSLLALAVAGQNPDAMYLMGNLEKSDENTMISDCKWMVLAASKGHKKAQQAVADCKKKLTKSQFVEVIKSARSQFTLKLTGEQ